MTGKQINTLLSVAGYVPSVKCLWTGGSKDFSCKLGKQMALKCRQTRLLIYLNKKIKKSSEMYSFTLLTCT